uniref:Asparagine synthetase [glutamine-hydrolyzing] n=1 Tax=Romanomermis culicivorax TaxID=13658 RepID=A0A915IZP9_ROMCU
MLALTIFSTRLRHRGPDWTGIEIVGNNFFGHERLSIVDLYTGNQPLKSKCKYCRTITVANGEIYNHRKLREEGTLGKHHIYGSESDCEVILHLYEQYDQDAPKYMDGDFGFAVYDGENFLIARDPIGVVPLYQGWSDDGSIWVASEMKALMETCNKIIPFPPGHLYSSKDHEFKPWYQPKWYNKEKILREPLSYNILRETLERAVTKRLMCDVPYGVLLSGGLDSSLVASIMARKLKEQMDSESRPPPKIARLANPAGNGVELEQWYRPVLHSFSIGLIGSPDLKAAKEVAHFLGTSHHEFNFHVQEGIDSLAEVIYHLETYDVTTIRASTPMYLMSRRIKSLGIKMILSGEGADEIMGGYLYFHQAPNEVEFQRECIDRIKNLHLSDCLRANKSTAAWGLEVRVPFLDRDFLDVAMSFDPAEKLCKQGEKIEKYALRKAFDQPEDPYLPPHILWRQKEQFSDGVGYSWIDSLKEHGESQVTNGEMAEASKIFPEDTPTTKEAYLYRKIFERLFPNPACRSTVKRWIPRTDWGCSADPSGRAQKVHVAAI